jgi:hypothetical protein
MALTQEQLNEWLAKWQPILSLRDWDIKVKMVDWTDPEKADERDWKYDPESTLVHELIHCHFAAFMDHDHDSVLHALQEQAIEALAKALIDRDRTNRTDQHDNKPLTDTDVH